MSVLNLKFQGNVNIIIKYLKTGWQIIKSCSSFFNFSTLVLAS